MEKTLYDKLNEFAALFEKQQIETLKKRGLDCISNISDCKTRWIEGKKYVKVNIGHSGRYMVEVATQKIFGIKAYGVIHRGHQYGTLDTIHQYYWGEYHAYKIPQPAPPAPVSIAPQF